MDTILKLNKKIQVHPKKKCKLSQPKNAMNAKSEEKHCVPLWEINE